MLRILVIAGVLALLHQDVLAGFTVPMEHVEKYVGAVVGTGPNKGQCAAGIQTIFYEHQKKEILGLTSTWRRGVKVWKNKNIALGTAIASFKSKEKYGSHAAIYAGQNCSGLQVYDQWVGHAFSLRTLRINYNGGNPESNKADRFYVIEH